MSATELKEEILSATPLNSDVIGIITEHTLIDVKPILEQLMFVILTCGGDFGYEHSMYRLGKVKSFSEYLKCNEKFLSNYINKQETQDKFRKFAEVLDNIKNNECKYYDLRNGIYKPFIRMFPIIKCFSPRNRSYIMDNIDEWIIKTFKH